MSDAQLHHAHRLRISRPGETACFGAWIMREGAPHVERKL